MSELENARRRALAAGRELTEFEVLLARAVDQGPGAPDESENVILPARDLWDFADGHPRLAAPTKSPPGRGGKTPTSPRPVETDDVIVLLLGAPGGPYEPGYMEGVTRLGKLVFLLERETPARRWLAEAADFRSHRFGPFASKVYQAVDSLSAYGLLQDSVRRADTTEDQWEAVNVAGVDVDPYTTRTFKLTPRGHQYYDALIAEIPAEAEGVLRKFKSRFAGLPLRQLVRYLHERYPEAFSGRGEVNDGC